MSETIQLAVGTALATLMVAVVIAVILALGLVVTTLSDLALDWLGKRRGENDQD